MSGVRTGTRLDQLEQLQRAARLQRAHARWRRDWTEHERLDDLVWRITREIAAETKRRPAVAAGVRTRDEHVQDHLKRLGVTSHTVKAWAVQQGIISAVVRGRVSGALVDAYEAALTTTEQEPPS